MQWGGRLIEQIDLPLLYLLSSRMVMVATIDPDNQKG